MRKNSHWINLIEHRAYARLRELRSRGLWDGTPPIPVDFIAEHLLDLRISWEQINEKDSEVIFACLRPDSRELVLNERHRSRFANYPGLERFSKAHEIGHADVFALGALASQIPLLARGQYLPVRRTATKGDVTLIQPYLRHLPPQARADVFEGIAAWERDRKASGEDSPLVRRAVDHYAAVLLMPGDLVAREAAGRDLATPKEVSALAGRFVVSVAAMRIRLKELGLIFGVDDTGRVLLDDPNKQPTLF